MDKKPKEPQEHGCPAEIKCSITGFAKKQGGRGKNHPLLPAAAAAPPPPTTTTITAGNKSGNLAKVVVVHLLIIVAMVVATTAPLLGTSPEMSSKLHSFTVSPANKSSTAVCDAVLSVKKNEGSYKHLWVELGRASVVYREERIWEKVMEPFHLEDEEEIMIRVNMSAGAALWQRVAGDFAAEKSRNGTVELEFSVDAIAKNEGRGEELISIEILCRDLKVGFRSNSEAGQLIDGSKKCKTKWTDD